MRSGSPGVYAATDGPSPLRHRLPPAWTLGLWLSTSFTTNYDEQTVKSFLDGMKQRDCHLSVFHFDCMWMKRFEWWVGERGRRQMFPKLTGAWLSRRSSFVFDKEMFPDPRKTLQSLGKDYNVSTSLWINSYIGQASPLFQEGLDNDYFIKRTNGDVFQWV